MKEEKLIKKIEALAARFKRRAVISPNDDKRHDSVKQDEKKTMWEAYDRLGWSWAKISSVFDRDWRTVEQAIESYKITSNIVVPSICIRSPFNTIFTDRLDYAKFASVEVSITSGIEAKGCWGLVKVLPSGPSLYLHWRGNPFTSEQTDVSRIIIRPEIAAYLNVAVALPSNNVIEMSLKAKP
jgi:hypothetical protein